MPDAVPTPEHLLIVGAGFSHNAGLPLATEFTEKLLDVSRVKPGKASQVLVAYLRTFVNDVFGNGAMVQPDEWPQLEDLFTTVDLAANTGHNLGPSYSASELRTVRRALLVRLIRMLTTTLRANRKRANLPWQETEAFFDALPVKRVAFLSMNWDTVIEDFVTARLGEHNIDYGCSAISADFDKAGVVYAAPPFRKLTVLKPHGSVNWMYCDACSRLYWFPPARSERIAAHLFKASDADVVERRINARPSAARSTAACLDCGAQALGTRFATFSYRKALEFPMHQATWNRAEELLREAETWTFFGYSMPAADYQFKHLLKRVHLSRRTKPRLGCGPITLARVGAV